MAHWTNDIIDEQENIDINDDVPNVQITINRVISYLQYNRNNFPPEIQGNRFAETIYAAKLAKKIALE